jgi:hypothetical protein
MLECPEISVGQSLRDGTGAYHSYSALRRREVQLTLAAIRKAHQKERQKELLKHLVSYWPVAVGIVLACFAPLLRDLVAPIEPWGMRLVFPFAVLAGRPELYMGNEMARILPQIMLFLQFPIEGLLARYFLSKRVTLSAVGGQVFFVHFLCAVQLWLVSGTLDQIASR